VLVCAGAALGAKRIQLGDSKALFLKEVLLKCCFSLRKANVRLS